MWWWMPDERRHHRVVSATLWWCELLFKLFPQWLSFYGLCFLQGRFSNFQGYIINSFHKLLNLQAESVLVLFEIATTNGSWFKGASILFFLNNYFYELIETIYFICIFIQIKVWHITLFVVSFSWCVIFINSYLLNFKLPISYPLVIDLW